MSILAIRNNRREVGKPIQCLHFRGEGVLNKCLQYGEAPPRGPTPHPFTIFHEKGTSLVYLLLRNGTPLNLVALCISFNCCKCTVFYIGINHNKVMFSRLDFLSHKIYLLALFGPFTDPNDRFPYPFIHFNW